MLRAYVDAQPPASAEERRSLIRTARLACLPLGTLQLTMWHVPALQSFCPRAAFRLTIGVISQLPSR
jgi:hypothetical protein